MISPTSKPEVNRMAIKVNVLTGVTPTQRIFPHLNKMQPMQKNVNKIPADNQSVITLSCPKKAPPKKALSTKV
jgi:hypothetical protein